MNDSYRYFSFQLLLPIEIINRLIELSDLQQTSIENMVEEWIEECIPSEDDMDEIREKYGVRK